MAEAIKPIGHLDGGLTPVFLFDAEHKINQSEFIKQVYETTGEPQFYLLAHEQMTFKKENNVQTSKYQPRFFLVNYSTIGYTCDAIELASFNDRRDSFGRVAKETANFALPKIPASMIAEIDAFFRYVYDKNKSEGIVILTYDPETVGDNTDDGLGWGYQIPEQENSAGRCDYKADSIIEHMEESAYVVGSCHSHPMMSAFCSGVDKDDQADFPGVHITFGWGDKGADPNVTHHHIEFQLGDQAWSLKPQQIFAEPELSELPEEVAKIVDERVKKSAPANTSKSKHLPAKGQNYPHYRGNQNKNKTSSKKKSPYYEPRAPKSTVERVNLPDELKGIPWNNSNNILVWSPLLEGKDIDNCPVCDNEMDLDQITAFRCRECHTYVHGVENDFSDILEYRKSTKTLPHAGLSMRHDQPHSIWYVVERYEDDDADNNKTILEIDCIHQGTTYDTMIQKAKA